MLNAAFLRLHELEKDGADSKNKKQTNKKQTNKQKIVEMMNRANSDVS